MKKLSILFVLVVAMVSWNCSRKEDNHYSDIKHSVSRGGCCCCCGGDGGGRSGGGKSGNVSSLGFRGFGQPSTAIDVSVTGEVPADITITIDPAKNPEPGSGWSLAQPIQFHSAQPNARAIVYDITTPSDYHIVYPGIIYTIAAFTGPAKTFRIDVYRNYTMNQLYTSRSTFYDPGNPGDLNAIYSGPSPGATANLIIN